MNREVDFERRLADWLEDGPFDAPDRAIQFAVGHARTHPRGRLSRSALWRGVMNRMNLNHVATPARVGGLLAAAIVVVALVAVAVVGSGAIRLGDGANQIPGVGGPGRPTPTVAPPPTPVPATGSSTCTHTATGTTASLGEVTDYRGIVLTCTDTMSDPRVSGTGTNNVSVDERPDGSADIWGTYAVRNAGGTWEGRWSGTVDKGYTTHRVEGLLRGTGDYAGLEYRIHLVSEDEAAHSTITGTIAPTGTLITGTETCLTRSQGTTVNAGDVDATRGVAMDCTDAASDPRVSGTSTAIISVDERADGSADIWGTFILRNAGGTWEGRWSGTVDAGYATHRIDSLAVGSGDYAGLEYRFHVVSEDQGAHSATTGTIAPAD